MANAIIAAVGGLLFLALAVTLAFDLSDWSDRIENPDRAGDDD